MIKEAKDYKKTEDAVVEKECSDVSKGMMKIIIHRGISLVNKDMIGKSDPYAVVQFGTQKSKSKAIKANLNPVWEHEVNIDLDKDTEDIINITVHDEDIGKDDLMGSLEIPIREVLTNKMLLRRRST